MSDKKQSKLEAVFELGLWYSRFIVMFAVIFSILSSLILFLLASYDISFMLYETSKGFFHSPVT